MIPDWYRLQWYGVLAIGTGFSAAALYIAVRLDSNGWIAFLFFLLCAAAAVHELWPQFVEGKHDDDPAALLVRFPGPLRLRVPRRRLLFFFVSFVIFGICIAFVALQSEYGWFGTAMLWLGAAGCVAAIPVFLIMILRGSTLKLDAQALEIFQGMKRTTIPWRDVSEFSVADVGQFTPAQHWMVMFDETGTQDSRLGGFNRSLLGKSGGLPDTYGMDAFDLAWLLNEWRNRALQSDGGAASSLAAGRA